MSDDVSKQVASGEKFRNSQGIRAIKDGQKRRAAEAEPVIFEPKPKWLRARIPAGDRFEAVKANVTSHKLSTVCQESHCPNMGECWGEGTATFMILGNICTRSCGFCAVVTGRPENVDPFEPVRVAKSVKLMGVKHCVLTSVDRDDIPDGGSEIWVETVKESYPVP